LNVDRLLSAVGVVYTERWSVNPTVSLAPAESCAVVSGAQLLCDWSVRVFVVAVDVAASSTTAIL
jgi:hypothetical protein